MQRHQRYSLLALGLALLLAVSDAFVPAPIQQPQRQRPQQRAPSAGVAAAAPGQEQAEAAGDRHRGALKDVGYWLRRAWALAAPVGVMVALPLAGAPMRCVFADGCWIH